ncbi:hypothetical protein [Amycolatopsis magusensis]|uniref:hypothetical protein n=1 Tax=Amycolatopsis magusensis TaxID=882444 RepID=UPI00379D74AB
MTDNQSADPADGDRPAGLSQHRRAAINVAALADRVVAVAEPGTTWRTALWRWLRPRSSGGWPEHVTLDAPWQDTASPERPGWRERAANLDGQQIFAVDYLTCAPCGIGWVEQPATEPDYRRCGLARAALAAVRTEHPGLTWHTLGRHLSDSRAFWIAIGTDVPGSYTPRRLCHHAHARTHSRV